MKLPLFFPTRRTVITLLLLGWSSLTVASCIAGEKNRDRFKPDLAGNKEVAEVIKNFKGRGAVGDDSDPTPPDEALKLFQLADGLTIDLVAHEPEIEQPLYMHFDDRGRLWVVQYRQYPFPAGLKVIRYDQYLRAVFDKVPQPPPNHVPGKDKITLLEDTNGDGRYDSTKDVITGLNITSSVVTGHGGIWVLNPPYLLFYPDEDRNDIPDADPVVCLSGFGLEDTHSVANSLHWGPDGWLYGANGSTTTGNISSAVNKNVRYEGQCIWRYHPDWQVFEIYAEGGGNTFSCEIDQQGRLFSGTNHGSTRGMYYPQGSYGTKNWGKHGPLTNPFAFGFFVHMRHKGDGDRFAQTFIIYEGGALPETYQGSVIAANSLHNRVWASDLLRDGSTYQTVDRPPIVTTPDHWFRPVDIKVGPDGAVYLADWYDTRLTHVDPRDNWHKQSGRIYRVGAAAPTSYPRIPGQASDVSFDLTKLTEDQLIGLFAHPNKWRRQTAVRVLGERLTQTEDDATFDSTVSKLRQLATDPNSDVSLEALWTLHLVGDFDEALAETLFSHPNEHVRRWAVRLLGDARLINDRLGEALVQLAKRESYIQVRSQLASSARRFAAKYGLPILRELALRDEDAADPHMPLQIWWGFEGHTANHAARGPQIGVPLPEEKENRSPSPRAQLLALLEQDASLWNARIFRQTVLPRLMKRFAIDDADPFANPQESEQDGPTAVMMCEKLLSLAPSDEHRELLMSGFLEAYEGRSIENLPKSLSAAIDAYQKSRGESDLVLGLRRGQSEALDAALKVIRNSSAPIAERLALIEVLGQVPQPKAVPVLLGLIGSSQPPGIKRAVMTALMSYDDPKIGQTICSRYHSSLPDQHGLRATAHRVLASRPVWTKQFLNEIEQFRIKPQTVALDIVQQMRLHDDPEIQKLLDKHWGRTRATPEEKQKQIARLYDLVKSMLTDPSDADPKEGHQLFKKHCATCHTLFGEGGQTGPKLTGYERDNLGFMLLAIVDPSAAIREEFTQFQIVTDDGRTLTGLIDNQTPNTVTLRGANNQLTVIPRSKIEILKAMEISIMPDGLMDKLNDQEIRNLFAYLVRRTPLPTDVGASAEKENASQ